MIIMRSRISWRTKSKNSQSNNARFPHKYWCLFQVSFFANFEHILHFVLAFLLLTSLLIIFHHWFSLHFFVDFMKKWFYSFYCRLDHLSWTYKVAKFWMIKLCLDASDVIHANKHIICWLWLTCKHLEILVDVILFYDEKESF